MLRVGDSIEGRW